MSVVPIAAPCSPTQSYLPPGEPAPSSGVPHSRSRKSLPEPSASGRRLLARRRFSASFPLGRCSTGRHGFLCASRGRRAAPRWVGASPVLKFPQGNRVESLKRRNSDSDSFAQASANRAYRLWLPGRRRCWAPRTPRFAVAAQRVSPLNWHWLLPLCARKRTAICGP